MPLRRTILICLAVSLWITAPLHAGSGDISNVIESFMAKQFPDALGHLWVVNGTQWQTENELVIDLHTIVRGQSGSSPTENRFLLLIVSGKLAAAQNIPLEGGDCQPEQT
ncbi:MAG: hypothetical protein EPO61_08910 [Nitrospirae bacterium]|nr:MAG: hypothetical protein EPO61_08910 [Nitrospirota bacterium]